MCLWRLAPNDAGRRALFTLLRNKWTLDLWQGQSKGQDEGLGCSRDTGHRSLARHLEVA